MGAPDFVETVEIPLDVCDYTRQVMRKHADNFKKSGKEDEPPLRMLVHGLHGEGAPAHSGKPAPYPYMIQRDDKFYHGYRFDMDVCDEVFHATSALQKIFGKMDGEADQSFRNILGYAVGDTVFKSLDGGELFKNLTKALLPSALKIFGKEGNLEALKHSRIYSLYANLLLPGHIIKPHLDVPEIRGVDRSNCPSWLLVAAHCSGLFEKYRVKNVTSVFYPQTAFGGALCAYSEKLKEGKVLPVREGLTAVLDTDSHFHHSAQARASSSIPGEEVKVPILPARCSVKVEEQTNNKMVWSVVDQDTNQIVCSVPEEEIRFSVSCKFHIFSSEEEAKEYEDPAAGLTADQLIQTMTEDLISRGKIPDDWQEEKIPLYKLAPLLYTEYIEPRAPNTEEVERAWAGFM